MSLSMVIGRDELIVDIVSSSHRAKDLELRSDTKSEELSVKWKFFYKNFNSNVNRKLHK